MSQERSIEVLQRVLDGFNNHDIDAIMANFAEGCVFEVLEARDPWGRRFEGKAAVRRGLSAAIPGSRLVMLNGVGHVSTLEAPERVNEEVRSFLDRVPI